MIVPLVMTIYFSLIRYNPCSGRAWLHRAGQLSFLRHRPRPSAGHNQTRCFLLGSVIVITVIGGVALALLIDDPFPGRAVVRVLLISPFFVMPTVNALLWKHMMMNPSTGLFAQVWIFFGCNRGLDDGLAAVLRDLDGCLAVVAVCHAYLRDCAAVDERDEQLEAAPWMARTPPTAALSVCSNTRALDRGRDHDRDDFSS